ANPAFDEKDKSNLPEGTHRGLRSIDLVQTLPPLENTVEEAQTIAQLFPESRVLLGTNATEAAVKAAHAPRILHLATHGFFVPEQLARAGENPLLRSGIALAGFNQRQSGKDDGVLTALETAALDLNGTKLVVLSTCESGLGQATSGEGVYGLRRALAISGSETQVMSLWQVDTGRTRELMQAYYGRLQRGEGRSDAMREVQLDMLANSDTAHPNLWASFIVSGEWRTLDGHVRVPEVLRVSPGLRGCACTQVGHEAPSDSGWCVLILGGAIVLRRRVRAEKAC
ncbi:MAG TPA: CHAT domain-containing protein, partial [Polyangium sp.]|nr:CHAT domain-containing protein [Polyangium sp.]